MEGEKISTKSGFKCVIDTEVLDDWEVFEYFREIDRGKTSAIVDVAPRFLGEKQYEALKEHVRDENGKIRISTMISEINEIMMLLKASKN